MPYSQMTLEEAAEYLHLDLRELEKLVQKREIPYELVRGQTIFRRNHLRDWSTQRILAFKEKHLLEFHSSAQKRQKNIDIRKTFLSEMLREEFCIPHIPVKSKSKILKFLADKAFETGCVCDAKELYDLLEEREELCTTGLEEGVAMPHTRIHSEYLFLENFLLIGKAAGGVPFSSVDGKLTDLFFLPCTMDDKLHLYTISRLALMVQKTDLSERLRTADTAQEMFEIFLEEEATFVENYIGK